MSSGFLAGLSSPGRSIASGALACALLMAGCGTGGAKELRARTAPSNPGPIARDRIVWVHLQVLGKAESAEQAIETASLRTARVVERLRALGVAEEDLIATSFALDAGYRARSLLELTIRDSNRKDELIAAAEKAGARVVRSRPGTLP